MKKTAKKTAKPSPRNGNVLPLGNHPGNTGGKPGRSGRPRLEWKDAFAELRKDPDVQSAIERAAKDEKSRGFRSALAVLERYDPDRPALKLEHSGSIAIGLADRVKRARERTAKR